MAEEETTQQTVADVTNAVEAEPTEEKDFVVAEDSAPERPDWLPEKYKTPKEYQEGTFKLYLRDDENLNLVIKLED